VSNPGLRPATHEKVREAQSPHLDRVQISTPRRTAESVSYRDWPAVELDAAVRHRADQPARRGGAAIAAEAGRSAAVVPDRPWHVRWRRRQVQPGWTGSGSGRVGDTAARHARPAGDREWSARELTVHRTARRSTADRHLGNRFCCSAVRHRISRVLISAFQEEAADIDKNGRTSLWEAFAWAAGAVRRFYQERGQLATERPLLDDNGDGVGREASAQGLDGSVASRTYLAPAPAGAPPTDEVLVELLHRRASLVAEVEELQVKKAFLSPDEYAREFERIMLALARVGREIRARNPS
jgi:hypothetical protein